ncbi:MAG: lipid kinase [Alphaproteobacteria bacterium]|nr:MAG: lipid kinase [Alphaproteobacteria bacterium]
MPRRRALVILNGNARQGAAMADKVEEALTARGIGFLPVRLKKGVDASALIDLHAKDVDRVIVGGGDGTLNAAARGLMASGLPLGILPLGTANDLARTLGIPNDLEAAIDVIAAGKTRAIDVGEVNGSPFFNVASVGFSAELAKNLTKEAKRKWGVAGYAMTAAKVLWKSKPFSATLAYGTKEEHVHTLQVAIGNGHYYGGGMKVAADARPDDGKLDIYSLEVMHWLELPAMLPMLRSGTHAAWPTVRGLRVDAFELRTRKPMPVNADGEIVTMTPAKFRVREAAIKVFVGGDGV